MSEHTPGPWRWKEPYEDAGYYELVAIGDFGTHRNGQPVEPVIADDGSAGDEYSPVIAHDSPDARLIAAAPQLLTALCELVSQAVLVPDEAHAEFQSKVDIRNALAAIAAAEDTS